MASKRVTVIADLHSGHRIGLTPPLHQWRPKPKSNRPDTTQHNKWANLQSALWRHYVEALKRVKPIDILIVNGDMIDGKGARSGGTELISSDRVKQAEIASDAILEAEAPIIRCSYGTGYHTGLDEDMENLVIDKLRIADPGLDVKIGSHEWIDVNGVVIDFKHFTSRSSIPHGKGTPLSKEWLWNILWAEQNLQPRADIIIRSHVHYAFHCGEPGSWYACITPALQGMGSKYGAREMKGLVHFGILTFDITETGAWIPLWDIIQVQEQATKAEKL